jgi:hypothetical protein
VHRGRKLRARREFSEQLHTHHCVTVFPESQVRPRRKSSHLVYSKDNPQITQIPQTQERKISHENAQEAQKNYLVRGITFVHFMPFCG